MEMPYLGMKLEKQCVQADYNKIEVIPSIPAPAENDAKLRYLWVVNCLANLAAQAINDWSLCAGVFSRPNIQIFTGKLKGAN